VVTVKPGAERLAHVDMGTEKHPAIITWELAGGARVLALTGETDNPERWEYFVDMGSNLMIYLDRRPVPQDLSIVHLARDTIQQIYTRRALMLGLIDFIESFGANTRSITDGLEEADEIISRARPLYLDMRFVEAQEVFNEAVELLKAVESDAIQLKDRALFWVYMIEWLAVMGTFLVCGSIIWALMVRRRLYRVVDTTRFG
jgi:hypothetical protein